MLASRKRPAPLLIFILLLVVGLWCHNRSSDSAYAQWLASAESHSAKAPANSTLGFGTVLVVSKQGSARRRPLIQAANVTEIDLTIPQQPEWTEGDVQRFINGHSNTQKGSILAWLGHHNALRWFLDSGLETALILEDDVDWDIRLRSVQIPLAASATRQLLPPVRSRHPNINKNPNRTQYWGDQDGWDVLYLGHCGDYFDVVEEDGPKTDRQSYNLSAIAHKLYHDPTMPSWLDLHPFTQALFRLLGMPERTRVMHRSKLPLCSFGYAVTRQAAERLLNDLAPPKLKKNGARAFDVALLHACNKGENTPSPTPEWQHPKNSPDPKLRSKYPSPGLRCWTLNSELFHHMPGMSEIDMLSALSGEKPGLPPVDRAAQAQVVSRNETTNIDCGFWSGAFAFDNNDTERLHFLQEKVGRQGVCLKDKRQHEDAFYQPQTALD
ncbi:glycosyltransferase family 25 protein [Bipolaris maydis ATCC 48331]|uniref:Glycosyltransferase family 25 protein n=2 Tax=Cochliobolus heterostrophus TaxID=5016 RepID=M2UA48_COCH5|nr:glycosyltransferase family 25 protein [Bipolaris maydis ATCC 48331]EMD90621.1 glycosyltransferase family 25 protein [Bipolaris maydis C5]KAH7555552.1 glycosyltransferase family 25 protein [Bipolaris maydis]ENI09168.1 glycosyltransferase family 25 protein [Bipolaris maydis ATCC 48331]KAJ5023572.1 glycosyltransferase [Bipolaris maydis]KAJ6206518.1 glycosyltransferase family 25 protein [Bipolaris maydis]